MNLPLIPFHSIAVSIPFQWWFHLTKHSLMASLWYTREKCRRRMPWDVAVNVAKGCPVRRVSITRELVVTLQNSTKVLNHCGLSLWMLGDKVAFNLGRSFKGKVSYILCHEPVSFPHNQNLSDEVVWLPSGNQVFSIKSTWEARRATKMIQPWHV